MEIKKTQCIVLPLVLKKKWFNMIRGGIKHEEYRISKSVCRMIERCVGEWNMNTGQKKLVVTFFLGYQKDRPSMSYLVDTVFYSDYCNHPEWGEPEGWHCVIDLGNKVQIIEG